MKYYHGTNVKELKQLIPNFKTNNTIKKPVIYFTTNKVLALFYIWNRPYKYVTCSTNQYEIIEYIEEFPNQLYDFYNNNHGSIYECEEENGIIHESHIKGVYVSTVPVEIKNETIIVNAYKEILKEEQLGNIIIRRYDTLTMEEKTKFKKNRIRSIHMQKLLKPNEQLQESMALFMQETFKEEWDIACNNTEKEINDMINEWRISIGLSPIE